MLKRLVLVLATALMATAVPATAQTIYPLNRAEILAGAKFDFKVEFPGTIAEADARIVINGRSPAEVFGKAGSFVANEDGQGYSAFVIRDVTLPVGRYGVTAATGTAQSAVGWEVFGATKGRQAKNVILFIGDGLSVAHRTAARIMSKGIVEGRYGGELAIDDMPHMALVSTAGTDSIVTDSANSMSAYTTGHKSCVNALGVYCARNKNTLDHPKVETISEIVKRRLGMSVGVVTNTEIEDATPAGMVSHTRRRSDYNDIVKMFYDVKPEVMMGGGSVNFLAKSTPGSRRTDETDYIKLFQEAGYSFVATATEMLAASAKPETTKLLGLFNTGNVDGALDRLLLKKGTVARFPDQPELADQVRSALGILSKNPAGFVLMVESGRIDKYSHSMDPERAIFDTIMLDNAVKVAKEFAARQDDTMIVVVGDHAHPISVIGTYDDSRKGTTPREKLGVYQEAVFPNYPPADVNGYPATVDVSKRVALYFAAYPDHCWTGKPYLVGENSPTVPGPTPGTYVANEKNCEIPGSVRVQGNLPVDAQSETHSGDDVVLTAMGPGAEFFRGRIDNTRVFRAITNALGLGAN